MRSNISRRSFLQASTALCPTCLIAWSGVSEAQEPQEPQYPHRGQGNDLYYSVYRSSFIKRHLCANGRVLQQVWTTATAETNATRRWLRKSEVIYADGPAGADEVLTLFPLLVRRNTPLLRGEQDIVLGGGDNPLLEAGLALSCFSIELLNHRAGSDPDPRVTLDYCRRIVGYIAASELIDPETNGRSGIFLRNKQWWYQAKAASSDEYNGMILGLWFLDRALRQYPQHHDVVSPKTVKSILHRLGAELQDQDYYLRRIRLPLPSGIIADDDQPGRLAFAYQYPYTRAFLSALSRDYEGDALPRAYRAGLISLAFLNLPAGLSLLFRNQRDIYEIVLDFMKYDKYFNPNQAAINLITVLSADSNARSKEEIWEQGQKFFAEALEHGAVNDPLFGVIWDAWARDQNDTWAGTVPQRMYSSLVNPRGVQFHDLPLREAQNDPLAGRAISMVGETGRFLRGKDSATSAAWRISGADLRALGLDDSPGREELIAAYDRLAMLQKDAYVPVEGLGEALRHMGPPEGEQRRDRLSPLYFDEQPDRRFYVEYSGMRSMLARMLAVHFGLLDMPEHIVPPWESEAPRPLPVDGPSPAVFARSLSYEVEDARHTISMIRSSFGQAGNDEIVYPSEDGQLQHCWRDNDHPVRPLRRGAMFGPDREFDAARVIQSSYGSNLEVVARNGEYLFHMYRRGEEWRNNGRFTNGVRGAPGFIQSSFGSQGNFEVVVGHEDGGLVHFYRDNDDPAEPWRRTARFYQYDRNVDSVALIESNYGHLEIVFKHDDELFFMWRDSSGQWQGTRRIARNVRGTPAFLQSSGGNRGHFEVLVPDEGSGIRHIFRDNDDPSEPWIPAAHFARELGDIDCVGAVEGRDGILDIVAITDGGRLSFHRWPVSQRQNQGNSNSDGSGQGLPECPPPPAHCP